ncbi:ATP-binding protein [Agrobacterium tumefaciens]|uniref:sensor histidine kinase n=1 Tax=Agrobacterium tumefaciens TaxID=358 RepID=UPI00287DBF96|nr:ATP-binding protein [Agrobacterium tumefaciens]MDS7595406.1 ATP-binding protein [Agrobacterium tumefaciens]
MSKLFRDDLASKESIQDVVGALAAVVITLIVFYIDAFTSIESAIAVLYVVVLLLASPVLTHAGLYALSVICSILCLAGFAVDHLDSVDIPSLLRLMVSLAALWITITLLLKTSRANDKLVEANGALRESETRYRSIFEQSQVALWERDYSLVASFLQDIKRNGVDDFRSYALANPDMMAEAVSRIRTVAANEAARELLGLKSDEPLPVSLFPYVSTDSESMLEMLDCIFHGRSKFQGKCYITSRDGVEREVLLSLRFPDDPGSYHRVAVGMLDITQREKAQRALLDAQQELSNAARAATVVALAASYAHELNQPLGAIVVNAQTLIRWLDKDPPDLSSVRRSADRIVRDSQRASEIILNARNLIKQDERKLEPVSVSELVEETRTLMEHELQRDDVELTTEIADGLPLVSAVRIELQQVLINLISNAIQAIDGAESSKRSVHIALSREGETALSLRVKDTGPGIEEAVMPKLFSPFFSTKSSGMGMGLSVCRSMMEAVGGSLTARNDDRGGALFEMTIPLGAEA